jgi:hypothetical protein
LIVVDGKTIIEYEIVILHRSSSSQVLIRVADWHMPDNRTEWRRRRRRSGTVSSNNLPNCVRRM